jgi:hypothetical protein
MKTFACSILSLMLVSGARHARAAWQDHVPEGDSAFTVGGGHGRVSLLGRSAVGLGDRVELSTYLPLDALLFPNLSLKWRFYEGTGVALAIKGGAGGGLYPVAAGLTVPPAAVVGGVGFFGAAYQNADLTLSLAVAQPLTLSLRGGIMRVEYGSGAAIGAAGGGGAGGGTFSNSGHMNVPNGELELDAVLGPHNALIVDLEGYRASHDHNVLFPYAGWYHAVGEHFHFVVGAFDLFDLPRHGRVRIPPPYANLYWTF